MTRFYFIFFLTLLFSVAVQNTWADPAEMTREDSLAAGIIDGISVPDSVHANEVQKNLKNLPSAPRNPYGRHEQGAPIQSDSLSRRDSVNINREASQPYLSLFFMAAFNDFPERRLLAKELDSLARAQKKSTLQAFEEVHIAFPVGLELGFPIGNYLDLFTKSHSFWYRQIAVLGDSISSPDFQYAVYGNLLGLGLRFYLPTQLISLNQYGDFHLAFTWFWDFGFSGIYSPWGEVKSNPVPQAIGNGYEVKLGYERSMWGAWRVLVAAGYSKLSLSSDQNWKSLIPSTGTNEKAEWDLKALQFTFQFSYPFQFSKLEKDVSPVSVPAASVPKATE